jgi:trehalose 6-phosphate synthase/phosphatase
VNDSRLIVVSNRLPLTLKRGPPGGWVGEPSAGGLATAVGPVVQRTGGLWLGWPGEGPDRADPRRQEALDRWKRENGFVAVDLPRRLATRFYQGYPNQALWPLFHHFPSLLEFNPESWAAYVEANERFRDAVLEHLRPGDLVWVHDYHLMLLPRLLREAVPDVAVGFFLHIPFPASEVVRILPRRDDILIGVLGADCVAFQTHQHLSHFRSSVLRVLGLSSTMDRVFLEGRTVQLESRPIGIAPESFVGLLESNRAVHVALRKLRRRFKGRRLLLSVDRLDYTKGIPERLRAYRRLLGRAPHLREAVVLVQIAVPSRERIPRYRELKEQVDRLVGEIDGQFGTPEWTPVVYIHRSVPRADLVALYAASDLGWVTPLRDGMNLVAKEYVACQKGAAGVLVLSEFAGAAAEMGEAVIVNPYDEEQTAIAIERALALPVERRRERMAALHHRVTRNNAFAWAERSIDDLRHAARSRLHAGSGVPGRLPVGETTADFRACRHGVLLLAYDGTLVPLTSPPSEAVPPADLVSLLLRLRGAGRHRVAIVSGRSRLDLERWFGEVEGLWLAAEHGAVLRPPTGREWSAIRPSPPEDWKAQVLPVLEHFVDRTPGSFIEAKEYSLVWHFSMSDPEFGEWLANELVASLDELLAETELRALRAHKAVEVKFVWASKGEIVRHLEAVGPVPDFRLALGDDQTDEDLFAVMPPDAWTIRVGAGPSQARFRLGAPADVRRLLEALAGVAARTPVGRDAALEAASSSGIRISSYKAGE